MKRKYYNLSAQETLKTLGASRKGLIEREVEKRRKKFGKNVLPQKSLNPAWKVFLAQFKSPLVIVVLLAMAFSFLVGHIVDASFIAFVVLMNAVVGFYQENKSEKILAKLSQSVKFYCQVMRSGHKKEVDSEKLVVGDIVVLTAGNKIPADGRILKVNDLKINEASLTGEWLSINKNNVAIENEVALAERKNMVFMGSIVESGSGIFVVTETGINTQLGKISQLVKNQTETKTPLQKKFYKLSQQMVIYILVAIGVFAGVYVARGEDIYTVFVMSIALVVSAIPEGLLPAITVILVFAMRRLARKKALVRKLNATEGMGSVSIICMDKTGTLTKGKMQVSHILTSDEELLIKNDGLKNIYDPHSTDSHMKVLEIATLVNEAFVENYEDEFSDWIIRGRHTDKALLSAGLHAGINRQKLEKSFELIDKIEFNSANKYAIRVYRTRENKILIYLLGSPEQVIIRSKNIKLKESVISINSNEGEKFLRKSDKLASEGLRLLACAQKELSEADYNAINKQDLFSGMSLLGFIALKDPLREEVEGSLQIAKRAGIKPVVVTGDHKKTAQAIVNELGMNVKKENIMVGDDLDKIDDKQLYKKVKNIKVFARVAPEHKIRIVKALQQHNEVVAMVGDGVNDAPAIKAADIGIAVGNGTDIAKEVADIVLLDSSFSTIIKAIEQGRLARENIRRILVYLLADDFSELFLFFMTIIFGLPFPLYPIQILWINLAEDGLPDIALTTENSTDGIMDEKPVKISEPLLSRGFKEFMIIVLLVSGIAAFVSFYSILKLTDDIEKARTIVFTLIAFDSLAFAYVVKSFKHSIFSQTTFSNNILNGAILISILLLVGGIYIPFLQKILNTEYLKFIDWSIIVGVTVIEIIILEYFKRKLIKR